MPSPMFGGSQCQGRSREEIVACFDNCPSKFYFPTDKLRDQGMKVYPELRLELSESCDNHCSNYFTLDF